MKTLTFLFKSMRSIYLIKLFTRNQAPRSCNSYFTQNIMCIGHNVSQKKTDVISIGLSCKPVIIFTANFKNSFKFRI